jgi:membrane protein DedA with SNARE-associated domain
VCTTRAGRAAGGALTAATDVGAVYTGVLVADLIERFTYVGIFLVLFAAGLGVPIPEEIPVFAAGVLASENVVRWWAALAVCLVGVMAGDTALYWIGHHWGEHILEWRVTRFVLTREREAMITRAYQKHGIKIIFSARFVAGFRAAAFLTAGVVRIPFWKFFCADGVAALVGVPVGFALAYLFTDQVPAIMRGMHKIERVVALVLLLLVAGGIAYLAYRKSRAT